MTVPTCRSPHVSACHVSGIQRLSWSIFVMHTFLLQGLSTHFALREESIASMAMNSEQMLRELRVSHPPYTMIMRQIWCVYFFLQYMRMTCIAFFFQVEISSVYAIIIVHVYYCTYIYQHVAFASTSPVSSALSIRIVITFKISKWQYWRINWLSGVLRGAHTTTTFQFPIKKK